MKTSKLKGALQKRTVSVSFYQLLWVLVGGIANYAVVNPAINKIIESLPQSVLDSLGEHKGKILTALKAGGAGYAAYALGNLPTEARLALMGVATASGIELGGQMMGDKMVAIAGTGDLYLHNVGSTEILNLPINEQGGLLGVPTDEVSVFGVPTDEVSVFGGTTDLFDAPVYRI